MTNGKIRAYYWHIFTRLAELADFLDFTHPKYSFPSEEEVIYTNALHATLVFKDGSYLIVNAILDAETAIREHIYAYVYLESNGQRIFQYDDAPHHPALHTYPDHLHKGPKPSYGTDQAYALDISEVNFITVLDKIIHLISP